MTEHSVSRTIVKSPPELWAELSDPTALSRHLGELGEITITRLEPERTVAWEGEHARGTVELEPAGWGTKVTLEAAAAEEPAASGPAPAEDAPAADPTATEEPAPVSRSAENARRPGLLARLFGRRRRAAMAEPTDPEDGVMETAATLDDPAIGEGPAAEEVPPPDDGLPAVLTAALDALGSAHHRPFSRG